MPTTNQIPSLFPASVTICAFRLLLALVAGFAFAASAQTGFQVVPLTSAQPWQRMEFRITGVPTTTNPFDPDVIRVEGLFVLPSGQTVAVPAYWHQGYSRRLSGGSEVLSLSGTAEWRLRFAPPQSGAYTVTVSVFTNSQPCGEPVSTPFTVAGSAPVRSGYVRLNAAKQYFETGDGQPLRLIGANVCWHGSRGTYDYDDWFGAMQAAGENYARLWMWPYAFGLETEANSLNRYRLDRAWQLDYVLQLAEQRGIYLELCLDYHGMFALEPDYWGGNNFWPKNPYCITNGGPCLNPNGFFTNAVAKATYQKRLRYLVARYGYSPNLLAWQFFNEIDNVYSLLNATSVAAWHGEIGGWLRAHDPFGHLLTTSFTSVEPHPEMWKLPQLDYVCVHSYGAARPAAAFSSTTQGLLQKYGKPVLIDEYGTSWQGWNRAADPYLRGFRQGLWGGALGGSVGTAMSWWWENIQSENVYPTLTALGTILNRTGWGRGTWTNILFQASLTPPTTVGSVISNEQPFSVTLPLGSGWGSMLSGQLAVPNAGASSFSASTLNSFVHGTAHPDLRIPFRLNAWFTNNARLVMHLNSVSSNPILTVRADGVELYRTNLPNLDGGYSVNNEYNLDLTVNLPAGKRLVEILNAGGDWFYLDWVRLEQVLPATYANNWQAPCESIGLSGSRESLLYVVAPGAAFPGSGTNATLPLQQGQTITLTNWPAGDYLAEWYEPATANPVGYSQATTTNRSLTLT
ncbi:MAG TPA: DUF5060 domain-containing protein, partial [Candidatus Sulfotelmatobacter sp.]|nr:DUF5060 domain-containing protein [Candidatus Sulfotelmatobacter sp.]